MSELRTPQTIEEKIHAALSVPEPDPDFVRRLDGRLQTSAAARLHPARGVMDFLRRPAWAVCLAVAVFLLALFLAAGPQQVAAAVRGMLGYLPGIGFVERETTLRTLPAPVEQERDGIKVTVEQLVASSQQTVVVFKVEGLGPMQRPTAEDAPRCAGVQRLRLADGRELSPAGGEGEGWPSGYRTRAVFSALPEKENRPSLVIPCLDDTRPGAAPENWVFELPLQPAPAGFKPLEVVEVQNPPTKTAAPAQPTASAPTPAKMVSPVPYGIQFTLDKYVELEDGFLFSGSLAWEGTQFGFDEVGFDVYQLKAANAAGQPVPIEPVDRNIASGPMTGKRQTWMVRTAAKGYASPLTITLPALTVNQKTDVGFDLDLGEKPQDGQAWEIDQDITLDSQRSVHLNRAVFTRKSDGTYWLAFTFHADPAAVLGLSLWDPDNHSARISGAGGADGSGALEQSFSYDYLPTGIRRLQITEFTFPLSGPWSASINLPKSAELSTPAPPPPPACLNPERVARIEASPPAPLPEGLDGRLLASGPALEGVHFPTLYVAKLDGSEKVSVGSGGWADLSPDGQQVVYTFSDGMHLSDLGSGQNTLLSWAGENAYHPLWSPDGQVIAFVGSSDGIYIARPDGSSLRKVPYTGISSFLDGWLPDRKGLLVTNLGGEGSSVQAVDLDTGNTTVFFTIDNRKGGKALLSPDGRRVAFNDKVFGRPASGIYIANPDGSQKRLVADLGMISVSAAAWSPDGRWLLVTALEPVFDGTKTTNYLLQPDSCEVIRLAGISDEVVAWKWGRTG